MLIKNHDYDYVLYVILVQDGKRKGKKKESFKLFKLSF